MKCTSNERAFPLGLGLAFGLSLYSILGGCQGPGPLGRTDDAGTAAPRPPDGGAALESRAVLVRGVEWRGGVDLGPVLDAVVALDAPDGTRSERRTDSTGRATFDVAPSAVYTVSVYAPGYSLTTIVNPFARPDLFLRPDFHDGGVFGPIFLDGKTREIKLPRLPTPTQRAKLQGSLRGKASDKEVVLKGRWFNSDEIVIPAGTSHYELSVPKNQQFQVIAYERAPRQETQVGPIEGKTYRTFDDRIDRGFSYTQGPILADSAVDIDLASNVVGLDTVNTLWPARLDSARPGDTLSSIYVVDGDDSEVSFVSRFRVSPGGDSEIAATALRVPIAHPVTRLTLQQGTTTTTMSVPGIPSNFSVERGAFLKPPTESEGRLSRSQPVRLDDVSPDVERVDIILESATGDAVQRLYVWRTNGSLPPSILIPPVPSGAPDGKPSVAWLGFRTVAARPWTTESGLLEPFFDRIRPG